MAIRTKEQTTAIMSRVRSRNTAPEVALRKALWSHGLRYKTSDSKLPGKPDIVLSGKKIAIFVDGDFWHGHQWRQRGFNSLEEQFENNNNAAYWIEKIQRNSCRDHEATVKLIDSGWTVLRFWETEIDADLQQCVNLVLQTIENHDARSFNDVFPRHTAIEFFAGIGLMRLALENKKWAVTFANDFDPKKRELYEANFPADDFDDRDVRKLKADDLPTASLATASFPCNDLSLAGKWKGLSGEHSSTFWTFAKLIEDLGDRKPPLLLIENVTGFLNSHDGNDLADALSEINALGYSCDLFTINASSFVAQSRPRLFIVGCQTNDRDLISVPIDELQITATRPKRVVEFIQGHSSMDWCLRPLPDLPPANHQLADAMEDLPDDADEWWDDERAAYLMDQMSDRHAAVAQELMDQDSYTYCTVFRRVRHGKSMAELRTDGLAGCLRTPRGGSGRQIVVKLGRGEYHVRLMTPRECARLMGVPDSYRIDVPLNQALFGFGDAVCVPVIEWIIANHISPLMQEMMRGAPLKSR